MVLEGAVAFLEGFFAYRSYEENEGKQTAACTPHYSHLTVLRPSCIERVDISTRKGNPLVHHHKRRTRLQEIELPVCGNDNARDMSVHPVPHRQRSLRLA